MKKRVQAVKIIAAILTLSVGWSSFAANCTFKKEIGGALTEVDRLTSGEIHVFAPQLKKGPSDGIFAGATVQAMNNDGVTKVTMIGDAANVFDGDVSTEVGAEENDWNLLITLSEEKTLDNISVTFSETVYPWRFTIETKSEEGEWYTIKDVNKNKKGGVKNYNFDAVTAKYIRITNAAPTVKNMKICEVASTTEDVGGNEEENAFEKLLVAGLYNKSLNRMYAFETKTINSDMSAEDMYVTINVDEELTGLPEEITEQENLLKNATGMFISNANGAELEPSRAYNSDGSYYDAIPGAAFDGDPDTYAAAAMEWTYILQADMGEVNTVSKVVVQFREGSYPISFDIMVSEDGTSFSTVASESGNDKAGIHEFTFSPVRARWIRIRDNIAQENVRQMGVAELEAYEQSFESDFELRAFMIDGMDDKKPFGELATLR